ncbi:MAG: DUF421 domain-containing protein [Clostridia bacterium]|nr:DUF421 domain-containing protein [Clostridia bacterium]
MFTSFLRAIIMYIVVVCAIKFMGKRQIGELETSELVITFMISDIASIPMQNSDQPILSGLIPIGVLTCLEILISWLMMKSPKFRQLTCGKCVIIISDGKINQKELCKLRMSTYDLCEQLRQMNVFSINDVAYAIMETNGKLSVLKKSEKQPPDANSLKIDVQKANLDLTVISNGKINNYSLMLCKLTQEWLEKILQENNTKLDEIFLMTANFNKQFNIIKKERYE